MAQFYQVEVGSRLFECLTGRVQISVEDLLRRDPKLAIDEAVERMRQDLLSYWATDGHRLVAVGGN